MTRDGCPLCGVPHAACGQPSTTQPVDILAARETSVATQRYRVTVSGRPTVLKLSAEDAKAYPGAELVDTGGDTEQADATTDAPEAKARTTARNKARQPAANKQD
jgi:hypothetical protein